MTIDGEYTITSLMLDKENCQYIGTALFPNKEEKSIIIDFSEHFEYDPISNEIVQLTVDRCQSICDSIGNTDIV